MAIFRRLFSLFRRLSRLLSSLLVVFKCKYLMSDVSVGSDLNCGKGVYIACTDGGQIIFGNNVSFGPNVKIVAQGGSIGIGDNSHIGNGSLIVAKESIHIGTDALIAEYVVIRDQDHGLASDPIRLAGFVTAPIIIDDNVWLAAKSTVLKGVHIGGGAVVAAHALVNENVAARVIVAGVPAMQVGER